MDIGNKIKNARTKKGLSQKQLAEMAQIGEMTISQYERRLRQPKIEQLMKIANALGCSVYDLLNIETTAMLPASDFPDGRGLAREAFLLNLDDVFDDPKEFFKCMDDFSDLSRDEAMQIWDYAKWIKSKRSKDGDTDAKP